MNVYPFIEAEKQGSHNVRRACELLQVSRSAYYAHRAAGLSRRAVRDAELSVKIIEIHDDSKSTSGAARGTPRATSRRGVDPGRRARRPLG